MKRNTLKIIIFIVIVLIIMTIILLWKLSKDNGTNNILNSKYIPDEEIEDSQVLIKELESIKEIYQYYNGVKYINDYFAKMGSNEQTYEKIRAITYIKENEQEEQSINALIDQYKNARFYPKKAYYKDLNEIETIYVYTGSILKNEDNIQSTIGIIVDYENMSYKIRYYKNISEADQEKYFKIENNTYNEYVYYMSSEQELVREIFNIFKFQFIYEPEELYNSLNAEYKEKRFNNDINMYNEYVLDMKNKIENSTMIGYKTYDLSENEIKYIIEDSNRNQYTFIQNENLEFNIKLDVYTVMDELYGQKYNSLDVNSKVHTDVDMFIKMINSKDYKQAYNKLDDTFKENNFNTLEKFKEYIQNNFFENNFFNVESIETKEDIYIVHTTIKDSISSAAEKMDKIFLIKLEQGYDFKMSFNIE